MLAFTDLMGLSPSLCEESDDGQMNESNSSFIARDKHSMLLFY